MRSFHRGIGQAVCLLICLVLMGQSSAQTLDEQVILGQVDSLIALSRKAFREGDQGLANTLAARAQDLARSQSGEQSLAYIQACSGKADLYRQLGQYRQAEVTLGEVLTIQRARPLDLSFQNNLISLARVREEMGKLEGAAQCLEELDRIRQDSLDHQDPRRLATLGDLIRIYRDMGRYEQADSLFASARDLVTLAGLQPNIDYAHMVSTMADLYRETEQFALAEQYYLEALTVLAKLRQKETSEYVSNLTGLAGTYIDMGQVDKAGKYYRDAQDKVGSGWFNNRLDYGPVLKGLAEYYRLEQKYRKARNLYEQALDRMDRDLKTEFPSYALCLHDLATLDMQEGNWSYAEESLIVAKEIWERLPGARVPGYPKTMMALGEVYRNMGNLSKAESLFMEAKAYWEKTLGDQYPLYVINLIDLARLAWERDAYHQADSLYAQASVIGRRRLANAVHYMSERELAKYLQKFKDTQSEILSFALRSPVHDQTAGACYDNALFYKGFLLNAARQIRTHALADPGTTPIFLELSAMRRMIGKEYARPIEERVELNLFEARVDSLEKELACMISGKEDLMQQVEWTDIRQSLDTGQAAIEFIRYSPYPSTTADQVRYAAMVVTPDGSVPWMVDLFGEDTLSFVLQPNMPRDETYVKFIYASASRGFVVSGPPQPTLNELIWHKLEARGIRDYPEIFLSSAGVLYRLNIGAIEVGTDTLLLDQYRLHLVGSTRYLTQRPPVTEPSFLQDTAVIYGGIRYDPLPEFTQQDQNTPSSVPENMVENPDTMSVVSRALTSGWTYLPGTFKEVKSLRSLLDTVEIPHIQYTGTNAREETFKHMGQFGWPPSPRLIHIGTHGYFFPDPQEAPADHLLERQPVFMASDQPMMRSGLIMAGANFTWTTDQQPPSGMDDGTLTAYEISQLDLSGTELVVLSACETGLGDIEGNEGVYGLQRAFSIAGTRYLIMSLWQVDDEKTTRFMNTFYRHWLGINNPGKDHQEMDIHAAFLQTQKEMRDLFIDHYSWAGFILVE